MIVTFTPEIEKRIADCRDEFEAKIERALAQVARGETVDGDEFFDQLQRRQE